MRSTGDEQRHRNGAALDRLSRDGFAARFEESHRTLWCIAAACLGTRVGVEDVLQDAALVGLRKIDDFTPGTSFSAWMGQIVRYVARNHVRRRMRRRSAPLEAAESGRMDGSTSDSCARLVFDSSSSPAADEAGFDDEMMRALHGLDEDARMCLLLRVVLEKSYAEISLALELPEGTAMSHVHRARKRMRESLAPHFTDESMGQRSMDQRE